jgi:ABC-2 type transport system ATP-binding protein
VDEGTGVISVPVGVNGSDALIQSVRSLDEAGIETSGLGLRRPSLDDVFLALTGHAAEEEDDTAADGGKRRRGRRKSAEKNVERASS